jgi:hypothetical protein
VARFWLNPADMHPSPGPDHTRVIVGDVHGAYRGLELLLREVGAIDEAGDRVDSHFVVQLGDLVHLGDDVREADLHALELGLRWIDLQILGNHEAFYTHRLESAWWTHMHRPDQLHPELLARLPQLASEGHYHIAASIDGWILTHAGIHPHHQPPLLERAGEDPRAVVETLTGIFDERLANGRRVPIIDSSGPIRGYDTEPGGVLWCDFTEQEEVIGRNRLYQIVGHTPQDPGPRLVGGTIWAADMGGARTGTMSALVKGPREEEWTPVVLPAPDPLVG